MAPEWKRGKCYAYHKNEETVIKFLLSIFPNENTKKFKVTVSISRQIRKVTIVLTSKKWDNDFYVYETPRALNAVRLTFRIVPRFSAHL
jgi:hypothetical protein